jgi:uncharacterized protein YkwD
MNKFFSTFTPITGAVFSLTMTAIIPLGAISSQPVVGQTSINLGTLRSTALSQHNTYRAKHRSPNMALDNSLNSTAQSWAQYLASKGELEHSSRSQRNNAGENLYVFYTTQSSINGSTIAKNAVKSWYDEVSAYNYANPGFSSETGHFTQVVWKSSTKLGCGAAKGTARVSGRNYNAFYVVCHYAPAGNFQGQFPNNVLKP